jgi:hypothetical protein
VDLFVFALSCIIVLAATSILYSFTISRLYVSLLLVVKVLSYPNLIVKKFYIIEYYVNNKPLLNYFLLDILCWACDDKGASFLKGPYISTALLGVSIVDLVDYINLNIFNISIVLFLNLLS